MKILIKGAGDLATGVAMELKEAGHQIIMTEIAMPLTVRRQAAFSRAVCEGQAKVEGVTGRRVENYEQAKAVLDAADIAVIVDPEAKIRKEYQPDVLIDAILAKKNTGTRIDDAPCVIALGPGFEGGKDCYSVVETMRGTTLGKPLYKGSPIPNTGVPGMVGGYAMERLVKAGADGTMKAIAQIGDIVKKGDLLAMTGETPVYSLLDGIVRGMLQDGTAVYEGMKIGDIDPRIDESLVYTVSDKARRIGEGVKEAIRRFYFGNIGIALLAAGEAKRFGSNKLLEEVTVKNETKSMFRYITDICSEYRDCNKVIVSRYSEILDYAFSCGYHCVVNDAPEEGITRSIKLAMAELLNRKPDLNGIVFSVCDQPWISETSIESILTCAARNPGKIICAANGEKRGNPAYWSRSFFEELRSLTGDTGGKKIMQKYLQDVILCQVPTIELEDVDEKPAISSEKE